MGIYLAILVIHIVFYVFFIFETHINSILTVIESSLSFSLILGAVYLFLVKNPYYFYFFIGIVISSIPVFFVFPIFLLIIIPEVAFLYILTLRGPSRGEIYTKMKASRTKSFFHHDPALTRMYGMYGTAPGYSVLKMDEVWNPDSTKQIIAEEKDIALKKRYSMWKIAILTSVCIIGFFISAILSLVLYFKI